jgi:4-hydroxybenzoate polyprenyltransferase
VTGSYSYGGRGSVVASGTWSDLNGSHKGALMDETPQIGQPITVQVPPLGGHSVYSGAPLSWFASVILLVVLIGFIILVRSTITATRTADRKIPDAVVRRSIANRPLASPQRSKRRARAS